MLIKQDKRVSSIEENSYDLEWIEERFVCLSVGQSTVQFAKSCQLTAACTERRMVALGTEIQVFPLNFLL